MTPEERLKWLEANQPDNTAAINAVRTKMGLQRKIRPLRKDKGGFRIEPWHNWKQRGTSSN